MNTTGFVCRLTNGGFSQNVCVLVYFPTWPLVTSERKITTFSTAVTG